MRKLRRNTRLFRRNDSRLPMIQADGNANVFHIPADGTAEWIEAAAGDTGSGDEPKLPRFRMRAYNGGRLRIRGFGMPVVVDLSSTRLLNKSIAILQHHDSSRIVGHSDNVEINTASITATGVISGVGEAANEVRQTSANKFPWNTSIGAQPGSLERIERGKTVVVNGRKFAGPVIVARNNVLGEISFVPLQGDVSSTPAVVMAASWNDQGGSAMGFQAWLQANYPDADLSAEQAQQLEAAYDAWVADASNLTAAADMLRITEELFPEEDEDEGGAPPRQPNPPRRPIRAGGRQNPGAAPGVFDLNDYRSELARENARANSINSIVAQFGGDTKIEYNGEAHTVATLGNQWIEAGWSADALELELRRNSRPDAPPESLNGMTQITAQYGNSNVIEAALAMNYGLDEETAVAGLTQQESNQAVEARNRGMSLHMLLDMHIRAAGGSFHGNRKSDDYITAVNAASVSIQARGSGGMSTFNATNVLSNIAHKSMMQAIEYQGCIGFDIAATRNHTDFKTHTRVRLNAEGAFKKVGKDGELKSISASDEKFELGMDTRGLAWALTRQDIINDDLNQFRQIPAQVGGLWCESIDLELIMLLLSLSGTSFISAANKNLNTGAGSALGIDGLEAGRKKFRKQVYKGKSDSKITRSMSNTPSILLTGVELETMADDLYKEKTIHNITGSGAKSKEFKNNRHVGKYRPVSSNLVDNTDLTDNEGNPITGQSATKWWLLTDPKVRAALVISLFNGRRTPFMKSEPSALKVLGTEWIAYGDFGVGTEEPQAIQENTGA